MVLVVDNGFRFLERAVEILNRDRQIFLATNADQAYELAEKTGVFRGAGKSQSAR
jgi:hypothetical protein